MRIHLPPSRRTATVLTALVLTALSAQGQETSKLGDLPPPPKGFDKPEVILASGASIHTRTLISCTGTAPSPLLDQVGGKRDDRGRVLTHATCEIQDEPGIWAGGDCAAVPHPGGGTCPPLGIYAMKTGTRIGRNILRHVRGKPQEPLRFTGLGDACALGGRRAVAHLKGVPLKGAFAWLLWRCFMLIYLPSTERRVRILADWLLTPLVGRDIVSLETDLRQRILERVLQSQIRDDLNRAPE